MNTKISRCLFAAAIMAFATSCVNEVILPEEFEPTPDQEQTPDQELDSTLTVFTSIHEGLNITKSTLSDNLVPEWVSGDAIGVTSASDDNVRCELISAEEGTFNGKDITGASPYYAVYPYDEAHTFSGSVVTAVVPAAQTVSEGQYVAPGALVAASVSETTTLEFKNCVSLMQVNIPTDDIKSVVIESTGENEYLAGKFTMDLAAETLAPEVVGGDEALSTSVTLAAAEGALASGTYYIAVLPTTITGVKITFTNTSDKSVIVEKKAETILARSNGVTFGNFFTYDISTPEELLNWAKSSAKYTAWDVVNINDDIDMTSLASQYVEAQDFVGVFNGNGKTISGLTTPLFANLYGVVDNLTLNSNITYTKRTSQMPGHNQMVGMLAHIVYVTKREDAKISNVTTNGSITVNMTDEFKYYFGLGGVVGACNGAEMKNCANYAEVKVESINLSDLDKNGEETTANRLTVGGVVGLTQSSAKLTNCDNHGAVSVTSGCSVTKSQSVAGGVVGYVLGQKDSFTGCDNEGTVTNSAAKATCFLTGGVVGALGSQDGVIGQTAAWAGTLTELDNNGAVLDESAYETAADHYVGGVIGFVCISNSKLETLQNSGTVDMSARSGNYVYVGGIIGRWYQHQVATLSGATNAATGSVNVNSACKSKYIYAGGVIGERNGKSSGATAITILDSHNSAAITNNGTATSDVRMGGLAGQVKYGATIGALDGTLPDADQACTNTGLVSCSAQTVAARFGGIVGQIEEGTVNNIYGASNTGNVSYVSTVSGVTAPFMGGIGGVLSTSPANIIGCTSNCVISNESSASATGGAILARSNAATITIKDCKVAGSIFGKEIDDADESTLCAVFKKAETKTIENNTCL